ncbi:MAG: hypothetical protein WD851_06090, partial [Pirellulales bacterium]
MFFKRAAFTMSELALWLGFLMLLLANGCGHKEKQLAQTEAAIKARTAALVEDAAAPNPQPPTPNPQPATP